MNRRQTTGRSGFIIHHSLRSPADRRGGPPGALPDPAELGVARLDIVGLLAPGRQLVGPDLAALGLRVDAEQLRRVEAEDLRLDRVGQLRVAEVLDELVVDLDAAQA